MLRRLSEYFGFESMESSTEEFEKALPSEIMIKKRVTRKFNIAIEKNNYVNNKHSQKRLSKMILALTKLDRFLANFSFNDAVTKGLVWSLYNEEMGVQCEKYLLKRLDARPFNHKVLEVDVSIGILEGHLFDFENSEGKWLLNPTFSRIYVSKNKDKNYRRPFILLGNLILEWDPLLNICIPRKCTADLFKKFGYFFKIGEVSQYEKDSVIKRMGGLLMKWNNNEGTNYRTPFKFVDQILLTLANFSAAFGRNYYKKRYLPMKSNIENIEFSKFEFEISTELCELLPNRFTRDVNNVRLHIKTLEEMGNYYKLLVEYEKITKGETQFLFNLFIEFLRIYHKSLVGEQKASEKKEKKRIRKEKKKSQDPKKPLLLVKEVVSSDEFLEGENSKKKEPEENNTQNENENEKKEGIDTEEENLIKEDVQEEEDIKENTTPVINKNENKKKEVDDENKNKEADEKKKKGIDTKEENVIKEDTKEEGDIKENTTTTTTTEGVKENIKEGDELVN